MLAACRECVAPWLVWATVSMVQDGWRLDHYVRFELRSAVCASGMDSAAVSIAAGRWVDAASRGQLLRPNRDVPRVCYMSETCCMVLKMVL